MNALLLLVQSRKFIVATLTVAGACLIALVGFFKGLPESTILGVIGAVTGVAWKLMDTIASEDNSKREHLAFELEVINDDDESKGTPIPPEKRSN